MKGNQNLGATWAFQSEKCLLVDKNFTQPSFTKWHISILNNFSAAILELAKLFLPSQLGVKGSSSVCFEV